MARNKALDYLRRHNHFQVISQELAYLDDQETTISDWFSEQEINDSQLRMMFACCHPALPPEGQIALILKSLCGLSIQEIAQAFLTGKDTIEKRLYRAKEKIRQRGITLEIPAGTDLAPRLDSVLKTLYLLFNEGYHSQSETLIRLDLLEDALRFSKLLTEFPPTNRPDLKALLALMCFQTARADSRSDGAGGLLLLRDQDRSRWNHALIRQGIGYLVQSAVGDEITTYHLEAAIAHEHCIAPGYEATRWGELLRYYDLLWHLAPSPVVSLNRAVVLAELRGAQAGLQALNATADVLQNNYLQHAVEGELLARTGQKQAARICFERAILLTTSEAQKRFLSEKINRL